MTGPPIKGAAELAEKFRTLGPKLEQRVMRQAVLAGAGVFRDRARQKVATLAISAEAKARLRKALRSRRKRGKPGVVIAGVSIASLPRAQRPNRKADPADDPMVWGPMLNKGTGERFRGSQSRAAKWARQQTKSRKGYAGKLRAQPFIDPVFNEAAGDALAAVVARAEKGVEKIAEAKT